MRGSFRIGRIFGIPVGLHWSLLAVGGLLAFQLTDGLLPNAHPGHSTITYSVVGVGAAVVLFLTVLAHELAHALVARRHAMSVEGIDLWALGGVTRLRSAARTPQAEWRVAAAGPLMSFFCAGAFALTAFLVDRGARTGLIPVALWWLAIVNGVLALFNVLPAAPLDGGRILSGVLWRVSGDRFRASRTAAVAGWMLGWLVVGLGVAQSVLYDVAGGILTGVLGLFLVVAARAEKRAAKMRAQMAGTRVRDVTWFGVARAAPDTDARTMLRQRRRMGGLGVVAVEDGEGQVTGFVSEGQLRRAHDDGRGHTLIGTLAVPSHQVGRAGLDEDLSDALSRVQSRMPLVTVWDDENLVGMIVNDAVEERLAGATDR
jgi:Zn-dependent protease